MSQFPPVSSGIYFAPFLVAHSGCYSTPAVMDATWVLADPKGIMCKRLVDVWGRHRHCEERWGLKWEENCMLTGMHNCSSSRSRCWGPCRMGSYGLAGRELGRELGLAIFEAEDEQRLAGRAQK